jgi:pilus assembly protein FimV
MAWLESLAAKQGIAEEELVTSPEDRGDAAPDWIKTTEDAAQPDIEDEPSMEWLDQLSQEAAQEAAPSMESEDETPDWLQTEEPQPSPEIPIPTEPTPSEAIPDEGTPGEAAPTTDDEEGMAWLESLAAKQGIAEEELVTSPEERDDSPPGWLETIEIETETEIEEEISMEWLDQLSQEAKQEAAPSLEKGEETPDWLQPEDAKPQPPPETSIPAEPTPSEAIPPEAAPGETAADDDEGLEWLESLAEKQGIAEEELVTSPEGRSDATPDLLEPTKDEAQPEIQEEPSMEWLDQLSQDAAQEATPIPDTKDTAERETDEWLASLSLPEADSGTPTVTPTEGEGMGWLDSLAPRQEAVDGEVIPSPGDVSEESLDWLTTGEGDLETGVSQEGISTEDEPSSEWLDQLSQETDLESDAIEQMEPTEEWLTELDELEDEIMAEEEMGATPDAIDKVDEWIQSLEQPEEEDGGILEPDSEEPLFPSDILEEEETGFSLLEEQPETEPDADTVSSTVPEEQVDVETDGETAPSIIPEDQMDMMLKDETTPSIIPEWLQDVAEQRPEPDAIDEPPEWLPSIDDSIKDGPSKDVGEIAPTLPEEWQPESTVEDAPQFETQPEPTPKIKPKPKPPIDLSEELENARQAIHDTDIEEATNIYAKLIKKGKGIEEIIEDIEEALRKHPIDVSLWQVLGDALMRSDHLQEALDAYSKAEDLLR